MPVTFTLPIRLVASTNAREHWRVQSKRKKEQRDLAAMWTRSLAREFILPGGINPDGVYAVTLTRVGKRKMDDDNLAASAKYVRDGVADALGIDDGDETKVRWHYAQRTGKDYAVEVSIERGSVNHE